GHVPCASHGGTRRLAAGRCRYLSNEPSLDTVQRCRIFTAQQAVERTTPLPGPADGPDPRTHRLESEVAKIAQLALATLVGGRDSVPNVESGVRPRERPLGRRRLLFGTVCSAPGAGVPPLASRADDTHPVSKV